MTKKEKKEWILRNWNVSSGKRIAEMLKRYWCGRGEPSLDETVAAAKKIFKLV